MKSLRLILAAGLLTAALAAPSFAAENATKDEAVALVKKVVATIKSEGVDKTYAAITAKDAKYIDRDLYPIIYDIDGNCLAHGANPKLVGKNWMDIQDADGKYFVKDRTEKAKQGAPFWQDYKYANPLSKKIEPKEAYCQPMDKLIICAGVYKS